MEKEKINKLKNILKNADKKDPSEVKAEAQDFLESVSEEELITAEQALIEEGIGPGEMKHLCAAHLEMMEGNLEGLKESLPEDHPITTLILEHEEILKFLDELEKMGEKIEKATKSTDLSGDDHQKLRSITHHLVAAERHHQREEEVLFPEAEKYGLYGPPQIMTEEHVVLRALKKELDELAQHSEKMDFSEFKERLKALSGEIVQSLRDHIFKENNILYPAAIDVIPEEDWLKIKEDADKIGYCCFTPQYLKKK